VGQPAHGVGHAGGFGYTGEQHDAETGLLYLRARHYDPATGQFLQRDPLAGEVGAPVTQQPYLYAWNNPLRFADPSGRSPDDEMARAMALCEERGWNCQGLTPGMAREIVNGGNGTEVDPFDCVSAFTSGSPVDRGICLASIVVTGGRSAILARLSQLGQRAIVKGVFKQLDKAGIQYTSHAAGRILGREARGVTEDLVFKTYRQGRLYYDPLHKSYIRYDPTTGVTVSVTKPVGGVITSAFEGNPASRWVPIRWRPGQ
jgi:RHS repeat-associated protein